MSKIEIKIYNANKKDVEKVYTADGYDLMLGTVEDFMSIIDVDKLTDNRAILQMVAKGYSQLKPLIKDVFPEMTDEDFKMVKAKELVEAIMQIGTAVVESFGVLKSGN